MFLILFCLKENFFKKSMIISIDQMINTFADTSPGSGEIVDTKDNQKLLSKFFLM